MINIKVDVTGINARLSKMQDYFSIDKTDNGKKFISLLADKSVEIFQENSLLRMDNNKPPGSRPATRGKKLSISRYAKQFTKGLFISEQKIITDGVVIGVGINIPPGVLPPVEKKYEFRAGHFSEWIESLGIYKFAGLEAQNLFYMRHYGVGSKGTLMSYSARREYPNNLNLLGPSGALLSSDVVRGGIEEALEITKAISGNTFIEGKDKPTARLKKKDKKTGEYIVTTKQKIELAEEAAKQDINIDAVYGVSNVLDLMLKQISEESIIDFLKGNFESVKLAHGRDILMWHPGVRPYDWFNDTMYGKSIGTPFEEDLLKIDEMIRNSFLKLAGKI